MLMVPTVWGILTITFIIIQFVPGGPIDQIRQLLEGGKSPTGMEAAASTLKPGDETTRRGISPEDFDRPWYERYCRTFIWFARKDPEVPLYKAFFDWDNWDGMLLFKFGDSFYRNQNVLELISARLPVSASLGFWSFLITYPSCIMLGIAKAVKEGSKFDVATSILILIGYSIPGFVLAVLLIVFFGPGDAAFAPLVPISGLTSAGTVGYQDWSIWHKTIDYLQHLAAPVICLSIGSFAVLTVLTKNSVLEEVRKQYVTTARAKGVSERRILFRHILRNAMIPLVTGFPTRFVAIFFTGSVLIESIFNLDGLGLLGYESVLQRDYPVVLGNLFIMTMIGLFLALITDIGYVVVDPRITFEEAES
jgi:microcin C transport system permease protein